MKYIKKPISVDAYQLPNNAEALQDAPMWVKLAYSFDQLEYDEKCYQNRCWTICTLEGDMLACPGDYLIKGIYDELYPCNQEIFEATYEELK